MTVTILTGDCRDILREMHVLADRGDSHVTAIPALLPQKAPFPPPVEHFCDHPDSELRVDQHGWGDRGSFGFTLPGLGRRWFCAGHRKSGSRVLQDRGR